MKIFAVFVVVAALCLVTGCDSNDGPAERAGERVDEAAEKVGDAADNVADDVEDAVDGAR